MRDAGRIGFDIKGEYDNAATYEFLDVVYYNYSSYVAKKETTGNLPAEDNEFWQILAKGEAHGVTGVKGNSEKDYRQGDVNLTAANVGALPLSGGTINNASFPTIILKRDDKNYASGILFQNSSSDLMQMQCGFENASPENEVNFLLVEKKSGTTLLSISKTERTIYDSQSGKLKKILVEDDVKYKVGDTVQIIENNVFAGFITSSSTEIYFTIPLEKSAAGLQASINGKIRVRGIDGYLINLEDASSYDVSCFSRQNIVNNLLSFRVRKSDKSAFSTKNNFPVAVDGGFTITFS